MRRGPGNPTGGGGGAGRFAFPRLTQANIATVIACTMKAGQGGIAEVREEDIKGDDGTEWVRRITVHAAVVM